MNPLLNPPNGTIVMIVSFSLSQRIRVPVAITRICKDADVHRQQSNAI